MKEETREATTEEKKRERTCRDRNEDTRYSNEAAEENKSEKEDQNVASRREVMLSRRQFEEQREGGMKEEKGKSSPVLGRCRDPESLQVALYTKKMIRDVSH